MSIKTLVQKLLLFSFSAFLIWQSIQLIHAISQNIQGTSFGNAVVQSFLLNVFITGIFLIGYAVPLYRLLPDSYYTSVESQLFARACAFLHIDLFRKIVLLTFWTPRNNKKHFFNGKRNGFGQFEKNTRISESSHIFSFVSIIVASFYIGIVANICIAIVAAIINVILNFYPAALQRYNRLRLQNIYRHSTLL